MTSSALVANREKACKDCGEVWPADSEFFHAAKNVDGLSNQCKACRAEMDRARTVRSQLRAPTQRESTALLQKQFTKLIQKQEHVALTNS